MCEAAAMKTVDKVDHASDAITKCGFDFKMDFLQKPDAKFSSLQGGDADNKALPKMDIVGDDAKAAAVQGDAKGPDVKGDNKIYKPESADDVDGMNKGELKKIPNNGQDKDMLLKSPENEKAAKYLLPSLDLEIPIKNH